MSPETQTDVAVVLVGRNACEFIRECVRSLHAAVWNGCTFEIIYVDNGSTDDTLAMLAATYPDVRVIANPENLGYCRAANQGARIANSRHYFFLNDDTVVLDNAIEMLVRHCDAHPEVGTIGSRLFYPDLSEQWSGRRFPSPLNAIFGRRSFLAKVFPNARPVRKYLCKDELEGTEPFDVDWVSAAAMIVPREVFRQVGGFAEDYYYWHEIIICDRLKKAGKRVLLHPLSRIIHHEGKGSGARPFPVMKFHIVNFHHGAYRCFCDHYGMSKYNPIALAVGGALAVRGALLMAWAWVACRRRET